MNTQNDQVRAAAEQQAQKKVIEYRQQVGPAVQTQIFLNTTYPTLTEQEKAVLNEMIEPYAVNNAQGQRIGFSCNLNQALDQARRMIAAYNNNNNVSPTQQMKQEVKAAPVQPALDMKTGAQGTPQGEYKEPKNLNEAMAIINKIQDEKEKGQNNG